MASYTGAMFNEIEEMVKQLNEMVGTMVNHPSLVANLAKLNAKTRDALIAEGFSREEAMEILKAQSMVGKK